MADTTDIPASALPIATQSQAEAGLLNDVMMTPLRTAQAISSGSTVSVPAGAIVSYGGSSAPTGWLLAYGQSLLRADYADLFTAIGTTFGAADGTHFNVPDLRGYAIVGKDNMGGSAANVAQVTTNITCTNGNPSATVASATGLCIGMYINSANVPAGTTITAISGTTITMSGNASATNTVSGRFSIITDPQTLGTVGGAITQTMVTAQMPAHTHTGAMGGNNEGTDPGVGGDTASTGSAGGGQPHPNMQPSFVLNFIIKT